MMKLSKKLDIYVVKYGNYTFARVNNIWRINRSGLRDQYQEWSLVDALPFPVVGSSVVTSSLLESEFRNMKLDSLGI